MNTKLTIASTLLLTGIIILFCSDEGTAMGPPFGHHFGGFEGGPLGGFRGGPSRGFGSNSDSHGRILYQNPVDLIFL